MAKIDWNKSMVQVCGATGVRWNQDGAYFDAGGNEVTLDGKPADERPEMEASPLICDECGFVAKSPMGLKSHKRVHK